MANAIGKITIEGYRSIRMLDNFELRKLNVLIGANGAGNSIGVTGPSARMIGDSDTYRR